MTKHEEEEVDCDTKHHPFRKIVSYHLGQIWGSEFGESELHNFTGGGENVLLRAYSRAVWPRKAWEKRVGSVAVQRPREEEHLDRVKTKGDNGAVAAGDNGEPYRRKQLCPPQTTTHMRPNVAGAGSGDNEAKQGDGSEKLIRSCFAFFNPMTIILRVYSQRP